MPKQILRLNDFSGGLNNLKDASDIADNEVSNVQNMTFTKQGAVGGGYSMTNSTNNYLSAYENVHIDHIEPGYGLGYFETDFVRDAIVQTVATSVQTGGSESGFKYTGTDGLSLTVGGSAVNLTSSYPIGIKLLVTSNENNESDRIRSSSNGHYFVVGHNSNNLLLDRNISVDIETAQEFWAATVKGFSLGDQVLLQAHPDEHKIDVYSTNSSGGAILTVDDLTPTPIDDASDGAAWQASQSHTGITGTSNKYGSGLTCNIATDGSGNPTFTITSGGTGYTVDEEITFTDPHENTSNTAVLVVATVSKWGQDDIVLRSTASGINSKVLYLKVEDSIRCCDTADKNDSKIQWYGWINRKHFTLSTSIDTSSTGINSYMGYFAKDNNLSTPSATTSLVDGGTTPAVTATGSHPSAGVGFGLNIATNQSKEGLIRAGVYEFAQTFIYDGNQESLPLSYTSAASITVDDADDFKVLSLNVTATSPFDPRISGGRIYIREVDSNSEWLLLVDIHLSKGCRVRLTDEYSIWFDRGSNKFSCPTATASDNFIVSDLNSINYETINGFGSDIFSHALGDQGEFWKDSTVANNRAFICNVTTKDEDSGTTKLTATVKNYPDRIMYSMPNRYDTFPSFNYIEAAKGDSDYYVAIESFGDRILAYKQYSMDIINIASPNDFNWFLEDSKQYMGVKFHGAVSKTKYGVVWVNKNGLYLYDGSKIIDLSENKIDDSVWHDFIEEDSMVIYDQVTGLVYVVRSAGNGSTNYRGDTYMFDLKKGNFTYLHQFAIAGVTSASVYNTITNSVDTNFLDAPNTLISTDNGSSVRHYRLHRSYQSTITANLTTKNFTFGDPSIMKRIYAVYITYKSDTDLSGKFQYSTDGGSNYTTLSGLSTTNSATWQKGKWSGGSLPVTASTFMLRLSVSSGGVLAEINDIGIEYRIIRKRMA
tara:strand:- start:23 stop:2830 length:2808 start_codon:yes stop_codon:yes gene_type:complete